MRGRGTAQPGGDKAASYLADRFAKLGLRPLGEKNSYLQPIKFKETQFLPQPEFTFGNQSFKFGPEFFLTPEHSSLGTLLNDVAAASGLKVIPDPMPEEKSFYRSNHYFFVRKGIPGIMILGAPDGATQAWADRLRRWEKTDYHQPTDVVRHDWDWSGPRTVASVMLLMGLRAANDEAMPAWLAGSEFKRERGTDKPPPPEP